MARTQQEFRENYELIECRECGSQFNLGAQHYYDNLCPSCKEDEDGKDGVDPVAGSCYVCGEDVRSTEAHYSSKAAPYDVHGKVLVCPEHSNHVWSPSRGI